MKFGINRASIALFFVFLVAAYLAIFYGVEYSNRRKGPWEVTFTTTSSGEPSIQISQRFMGIWNAPVVFHGEQWASNTGPQTIRFERAGLIPIPFGRILFQDLRTLPGVVTFDFFGHEIELLPRVMYVNKRQVLWMPAPRIDLYPTNKLPFAPKPAKGWE